MLMCGIVRYEKEFDGVKDVFDLQVCLSFFPFSWVVVGKGEANWLTDWVEQRNLNNAFAYDLVPSASVCEAAIRAARRVNDFPTAVRVFEGKQAFFSFLCLLREVYVCVCTWCALWLILVGYRSQGENGERGTISGIS